MDSTPLFDVSVALETLGYRHGDAPFQGEWADRHWMSTPGPIYCGDTDNCGTGPLQAPNNVVLDGNGFQILYRQPVHLYELKQVAQAADHDTFHAYGVDGDLHWSYEAVKAWWIGPRRQIEHEARLLYVANSHLHNYYIELKRWLDYLYGDLYQDLQAYAFFLDTGRSPLPNDKLPNL